VQNPDVESLGFFSTLTKLFFKAFIHKGILSRELNKAFLTPSLWLKAFGQKTFSLVS